MLKNPMNLSYMSGLGPISFPIPGVSRVEVLPVLGSALTSVLVII